MALVLNNKTIATDREGYLKQLEDWSEPVAELIAKHENIALTADHWEVIRLTQRFYQQFDLSPAMRPLVKFVAQELGKEKGNSIYLMRLFPGSPAKLISKIAGLPRPTNCL